MIQTKTKEKIIEQIRQHNEITSNKLQYLGEPKKQIHNHRLIPIIYELQKEGMITINEHKISNKTYRVIKWNLVN